MQQLGGERLLLLNAEQDIERGLARWTGHDYKR
jgi:hypothetical protein